MKTFAFAGAAALAVVAVPVLAQQAPQRPAPEPMTRAAFQQMIAGQFARVDVDRDGFVTSEEAKTARAAKRAERGARQAERRAERFTRLDTNRDGQLSESEFNARPDRAERRAQRAERRKDRHFRVPMARFGGRAMERADADKDGRVSLAEATTRPLSRFDRLDANKDGTLTPDERRPAKRWRHRNRADRG